MRKLGMIVALGVAGLAVACGGSSRTSGDSGAGGATQGTNPGSGGTAGAAGGLSTGGTAGGGASGSCNLPSCLSSMSSDCQPSGACVEQTDAAGNTNTCYANGVKTISSLDMTTFAISVTLKNASKTCLTMSGPITATGATLTIKDGSGKAVGTLAADSAGNTTVTCTGGQPVALDSNCDLGTSNGASSSCTTGACTP